jgi:predicted Ser/Thr protein kinase
VTVFPVTEAAVLACVKHGKRIENGGHQGKIYLGNVGDRRLLVKASTEGSLVAALCRWMLRREHRAYRRLQGVEGVPYCYGLFSRCYLVLEFIDGQTFRHATIEDHTRFFEQLLVIITSIHELGLAHGDLMRKENILVSRDQRPYVIDFGVSVARKPGFHPLNHFWHGFLRQHDLNAWVKHKNYGNTENMSPDDARYYRPLRLEQIARVLKRTWVKIKRGIKGGWRA